MQLKSEMPATFISVERILEYTEDIPEEAAAKLETGTPSPINKQWGDRAGHYDRIHHLSLERPELPAAGCNFFTP
jgi:hypothetical protein